MYNLTDTAKVTSKEDLCIGFKDDKLFPKCIITCDTTIL